MKPGTAARVVTMPESYAGQLSAQPYAVRLGQRSIGVRRDVESLCSLGAVQAHCFPPLFKFVTSHRQMRNFFVSDRRITRTLAKKLCFYAPLCKIHEIAQGIARQISRSATE